MKWTFVGSESVDFVKQRIANLRVAGYEVMKSSGNYFVRRKKR